MKLSRCQALVLVALILSIFVILGWKDGLIIVAFWCVFLPADLLFKRWLSKRRWYR